MLVRMIIEWYILNRPVFSRSLQIALAKETRHVIVGTFVI